MKKSLLIYRNFNKGSRKRGFTIVELVIASGMFLTATLIIVGALVSLDIATRKARATRIAMDNVGAAVDTISRSLRTGYHYHCVASGNFGLISVPSDCQPAGSTGGGGSTTMAFESQSGDPLNSNDQWVYRLNNGSIERSTDSGSTYVALTAPEIRITTLRFWVDGTAIGSQQPFATILIRGIASTSAKTFTEFNIQTTVSQRTPNFF